MTKPQNTDSIALATGRSWPDWVAWLDARGGRDLTHKAIADLVFTELAERMERAGWWAQGVAVAYEQEIGRRVPGQRSDGSFEVAVSRSVDGPPDEAFATLAAALDAMPTMDGRASSDHRTSATRVRHFWRCTLDDGSKVTGAVEAGSPGKSRVAITHAALTAAADADRWRTYWKAALAEWFG
jgi:hypothetical protein